MKAAARANRAFFCIMQGAPAAENAPTQNIGVLLICSEFHFIQTVFLPGRNGLWTSGATGNQPSAEDLTAGSLADSSSVDIRSFRDLTELKDFIATFGDTIKLSQSSPRVVTDPAEELRALYERYVVRQHSAIARRIQPSSLSCVAC